MKIRSHQYVWSLLPLWHKVGIDSSTWTIEMLFSFSRKTKLIAFNLFNLIVPWNSIYNILTMRRLSTPVNAHVNVNLVMQFNTRRRKWRKHRPVYMWRICFLSISPSCYFLAPDQLWEPSRSITEGNTRMNLLCFLLLLCSHFTP